jgi:hypothetical protein
MRSHVGKKCVVMVTVVVTATAVVLGSGSTAQATEYVNQPLTLSRGEWALDFGLGIAHLDTEPEDFNGFGLNLELAGGLTSFLQLGLRTGVRLGRDGRASQADEFGRMFDTETYGTFHSTLADPEISVRWALVHSTAELGLEGRIYLPTEDGSVVGMMVAVPLLVHIGGVARLDTGVYVPIIFTDPDATTLVSIPFHLWFQASHEVYLGPITGVRFHDPGTSVPLGFGLGISLSYDVDLKTWLLFPNVKDSTKYFGAGVGLQVRF